MFGKKMVISDPMNIFSGKRYFNDILWAPAYNNNTLPDTGISSNKI
jgi:hypothetical protein